jgi:hypothetical protein
VIKLEKTIKLTRKMKTSKLTICVAVFFTLGSLWNYVCATDDSGHEELTSYYISLLGKEPVELRQERIRLVLKLAELANASTARLKEIRRLEEDCGSRCKDEIRKLSAEIEQSNRDLKAVTSQLASVKKKTVKQSLPMVAMYHAATVHCGDHKSAKIYSEMADYYIETFMKIDETARREEITQFHHDAYERTTRDIETEVFRVDCQWPMLSGMAELMNRQLEAQWQKKSKADR